MSPKTAQDSPKMAHGSWQSCCSSPSCSPRGLRVQLRGPRSTQDGSKTPQDGSKTPQDCPKMGPREAKPIFSHAPRGIDNPPGTCTDTGLGAASFRKRHPGLPTAKSSSKSPKTGTKNDPRTVPNPKICGRGGGRIRRKFQDLRFLDGKMVPRQLNIFQILSPDLKSSDCRFYGSKTPQDCPKMGPREAKVIFLHAP